MFRFALLGLILPCAAAAGTSTPSEVTALPDGTYEVTPQKSRATSDFWCAIGTHAQNQLARPSTQEIYVWRGRAPGVRGRTAVLFGFDPPPGGAAPSMTMSVDTVGNRLSVAQARQACFDRLVND